MSTVTIVLLVILVILIAALIGLYFFGKKAQKKQEEQQAQIEATKLSLNLPLSVQQFLKVPDMHCIKVLLLFLLFS